MRHPTDSTHVTLRSASTPNRAVDVWTGYSVNHHWVETYGSILDFEQDDQGLFYFRSIHADTYLSIDLEGEHPVSSEETASENTAFVMIRYDRI